MGIDRTEISPALQAKLVYAGANSTSFEHARRAAAELMDLAVSTKQIERLTERVGDERCVERDAAVERYTSLPLVERKDKPPGVAAPDVVAVTVDGGRLQILDRARNETAATQAETEEALAPDEHHRGTHWFEDKIAACLTMESQETKNDPCPEIPKLFVDPSRMAKLTRELKTKKAARGEDRGEAAATAEASGVAGTSGADAADAAGEWEPPEVQTKDVVATRRKWASFGPMVAYLAWR